MYPEYESVKDNLTKYKCLSCNKDYSNKLDGKLKKRFKNTFKFSDNDINKFILLLRKGVYPYESVDGWETFNETALPGKDEFYGNINMEHITDTDYLHLTRFCKDLGEYHGLYLKSDILLLADVFASHSLSSLSPLLPSSELLLLNTVRDTCQIERHLFFLRQSAFCKHLRSDHAFDVLN